MFSMTPALRASALCRRFIRSGQSNRSLAVVAQRSYSSSFRDRSSNDGSSDGGDKPNNSSNNTAGTTGASTRTTDTDTGDNQLHAAHQKAKQVNRAPASFMPVVNIPQGEFAHNAFFSLHRPLLGLSAEDERPFFSERPSVQEPNKIQRLLGLDMDHATDAEDTEEAVANYMMQTRPFEAPRAPAAGHENKSTDYLNEDHEEEHHFSQEDIDNEMFDNLEQTMEQMMMGARINDYGEIEEINIEQALPVHHMPQSDQVMDYLTAIQNKINSQQEQEGTGRRRGSGRAHIRGVSLALARKQSVSIQLARQRTRRQRSVTRNMVERKSSSNSS
ncbi:hypothetical protein BCR43DRAFT_491913, partial [Syncephalastrum racemosum]